MKPVTRRPPAQEVVLQHITGYWISQLVFVAARFGIADQLARGPQTPTALARKVGADPTALHRVLRALASVGIFAERPDGRFKLTPAAATLRTGVAGSLHDFALMMVDDYNWRSWAGLADGVAGGALPFDRVHGMPIFEYLKANPDKDRVFSASMASISGPENAAVAAAYDFGRFGTLVDVGGAHGHLLASILRRHKRLRGVLYDQPQVVAAAPRSGFVTAKAVAARCAVEGGSFFERVPPADAYVMKYILHDWDDERCIVILRNCRAAMSAGGRVLVVENVIARGNAPDWGKLLDINMLVLTGGKERTRAQFEELFAAAGLKLRKIHETGAAVKVLEAAAT